MTPEPSCSRHAVVEHYGGRWWCDNCADHRGDRAERDGSAQPPHSDNAQSDSAPWEPDVSYVVVGTHRWRSEGHGLWYADTEHTHRPLTWAALVGYARTNQLAITFADGAPIDTAPTDENEGASSDRQWPEGARP